MAPRLRDLVRELGPLGVRVEEPRSGSHWKVIGARGIVYPISAHNGLREEIPDIYVKRMCRALGLDYEALRKRL